MKNQLKATALTIALASIALVPAATVSVFLSADTAFAKSDKAGGNGKGNGGKSNTKSANAGKKPKKSNGSKRNASRGDGGKLGKRLNGFVDKITGKDRKVTRHASAKLTDPMHPSKMGNMNGALNANINAVLAHIRNGNTNGPVGHLAALAVANAGAEGAQDILNQQAEFDELTLQLGEAGYGSVSDYYLSLSDGAEPVGPLDDAIIALGGDPDPLALSPITDVEPDPADVADADTALINLTTAEDNILSYWNKNTGDEESEAMILEKLNERLEEHEGAILDAIGEDGMDGDLGDSVECGLEDGCEEPPLDDEFASID